MLVIQQIILSCVNTLQEGKRKRANFYLQSLLINKLSDVLELGENN